MALSRKSCGEKRRNKSHKWPEKQGAMNKKRRRLEKQRKALIAHAAN